MQQIPMKGGDECDAFSSTRLMHGCFHRPGNAKAAKRSYNKRARKTAKHELTDCVNQAIGHGDVCGVA